MKNSVAAVKLGTDKNFHKIEINKVYSKDINSYGVELLVDCDINNPFQGGSEMSWFSTKEEQEEEFNKLLKENDMSKCKLEEFKTFEEVKEHING